MKSVSIPGANDAEKERRRNKKEEEDNGETKQLNVGTADSYHELVLPACPPKSIFIFTLRFVAF